MERTKLINHCVDLENGYVDSTAISPAAGR